MRGWPKAKPRTGDVSRWIQSLNPACCKMMVNIGVRSSGAPEQQQSSTHVHTFRNFKHPNFPRSLGNFWDTIWRQIYLVQSRKLERMNMVARRVHWVWQQSFPHGEYRDLPPRRPYHSQIWEVIRTVRADNQWGNLQGCPDRIYNVVVHGDECILSEGITFIVEELANGFCNVKLVSLLLLEGTDETYDLDSSLHSRQWWKLQTSWPDHWLYYLWVKCKNLID